MTALATGRNTPRRLAKRYSKPVAGSATIYAGSLVALLTSGGYAVPAGTASSGRALFIADATVSGGGTDGLNQIEGDAACGRFENSASADLITFADIGQPCYIVDDQTVAKTDNSGARQIAGAIVDVDATGVWVDVGPTAVGPQGPQGEAA